MPKDRHTKILKGYAKVVMSKQIDAERLAQAKTLSIGGLDVGVSLWRS